MSRKVLLNVEKIRRLREASGLFSQVEFSEVTACVGPMRSVSRPRRRKQTPDDNRRQRRGRNDGLLRESGDDLGLCPGPRDSLDSGVAFDVSVWKAAGGRRAFYR